MSNKICDVNGNCYTTLGNLNTGPNIKGFNKPTFGQSQLETIPTPQTQNSVFNQDFYYQQQHPEYKLMSDMYNKQLLEQNSFTNKFLKPINIGVSTLGTLGSLYLGFKQYGLAKKQLGIAEEQWKRTKQELDRIQNVRKKLTDSYMNS